MEIKTSSTPEVDKILKDEYLKTNVNTLSKKIGRSEVFIKTRLRQLCLVIPKEIIEQRKLASRIQPGNVPPNKGKKQTAYMSAESIKKTMATRFQKGHQPSNTFKKNGIITVRHNYKRKGSNPYKYIRLGLGNWYPYHQHIYEKKHGKLPKGMVLRFKDGDSMNCKLTNLEVISRKKNMQLNSIHRYTPEIKKSIRLISKLNKKIKYAQE